VAKIVISVTGKNQTKKEATHEEDTSESKDAQGVGRAIEWKVTDHGVLYVASFFG